jgi:outer membrane protein TolC
MRFRPVILLTTLLIAFSGCRFARDEFHFPEHQVGPHEAIATEIEYPDVSSTLDPDLQATTGPRTIENPRDQESLDMTLAEAMRLALSNNNVIRSLGGSVVQAPSAAQTVFNPALIESDPRASVEAALSAFDAQFSSNLFSNQIDRRNNQRFSNLFLPFSQLSVGGYNFELGKTTATGARFALKHNVNYNRTEIFNPSLEFQSVYQVDYEAEYRQPLLQGAGVQFNRIAGPNSTAGGAGGVLLARLNTDISLTDFEAAVTRLVYDVEQAYWDLYFAYRDLDAKLAGRDSSLVTWRNIAERLRIGLRGGTPENEAQLRSQYFTFQAAVDDALSTLYSREERLRYLLGFPPNGPQLIRPATEPSTAKVVFPWQDVLNEAFVRRVELRRQKWQIKRRELELVAARNYLKPRLDAVALYRFRGLGDELIRSPGPTGFESAYQNLTTGNFQEWELSLQLNVPIGFRREYTALRNAQLQLARERALLKEQEFRVSHDLSEAVRSLQRAFQLMKTNLNRRVAAYYEVEALRARFDVGFEQLDILLQAERRLADADSAYYRALVDYMLGIRQVHFAKGSLLDYDEVSLAEGPWSSAAYRDALERSRHFKERDIDYGLRRPLPVSRGAYQQQSPEVLPMPGTEELTPPTPDTLNPSVSGEETLPQPAPAPNQLLELTPEPERPVEPANEGETVAD